MRKYVSLIVALVMLISLAACGNVEIDFGKKEDLTSSAEPIAPPSPTQEETAESKSVVKEACKSYAEFIAPMADGNITKAAVIDLDRNGVPEVIFTYYGDHNLYVLSYGETKGLIVIEPVTYSSTPVEVYISTSEPIIYYADHGHTQGTASYHKAECFKAGAEGLELIGSAEGDEWTDAPEEIWQDNDLFNEYDEKYDKAFDEKVKDIVGDGEFVSFFDICEDENAEEYIEEKLRVDFSEVKSDVPSEEDDSKKIMAAYRTVLEDIRSNPTDYYDASMEGVGVEENYFAIGDISGDGVPELIVRFEATFVAGMKAVIWAYDKESDEAYELMEVGVLDEFYSTGYIKSDAYHNHTGGNTIWPYTIDKADYAGGTVEDIYSFWSIEEENAFPERPYVPEDDADGDGVIYYISDLAQGEFTQKALTEEEYEDFIADYIPDNAKIPLEFSELTEDNVEAVG